RRPRPREYPRKLRSVTISRQTAAARVVKHHTWCVAPRPRPRSGGSLSAMPTEFPKLPIVTLDPARRSEREKYGGLYVLGIAGLVVIVALVAWFGYGLWSLRDVWANIYLLHDAHRSDAERIQAAYTLSRDPRMTPRQSWDICLRRTLPDLARYLIAE